MRLGRVVMAVLTALVVGGCGMSTAVSGTPVPATKGVTIKPSATPVPKSASTAPTTRQSVPPPSQPPVATTGALLEGPSAVVQAYFDAINTRDYRRAWELGGKNVGQSYDTFAAGFSNTDHDILTIRSVQGDTVTADLTAFDFDGTKRTFHGTYTVTGGTITRFSVRATG